VTILTTKRYCTIVKHHPVARLHLNETPESRMTMFKAKVFFRMLWVAAIILRRLDGSVSKSVIFEKKEHVQARLVSESRQRVNPICTCTATFASTRLASVLDSFRRLLAVCISFTHAHTQLLPCTLYYDIF